jgi:iron(III) transport system permease protein
MPATRRQARSTRPIAFGLALVCAGLALGSLAAWDHRTWTLVRNTLVLSGATCAIGLPLGTLMAWLVTRTDLPGRRAAIVLFGAMLFVPLYVQSAGWQAGFGLQGWCTMIFRAPVWLEGWSGAIWVHAMAALPWIVLIVGAGLVQVEPELEEQALLDATAFQTFRRVTLPSARGAIVLAGLWVAIVTAGEMTVTDLFMVRTYAEEIYTLLAVGPQPDDPPLGIGGGLVLAVLLVTAGLLVVLRLVPGDRPISVRRRVVFSLGGLRKPSACLAALVLLLAVGVPLASLCYQAGVTVTQIDADRVRSWSPAKCLTLVATSGHRYAGELRWSLTIGALAATAATGAAIVLAWVAQAGRMTAAPVLLAAAVSLALPGPMVGLLVIGLMNRPEVPPLLYLYDQSIAAPVVALWMRGLGPATLILWHAFRTIPRAMLDGAAIDGAGPMAQLAWIAIPCRLRALALAWIVAFALALGDLAASILVVPPGVTTLSIRIFNLLHYGVEDQVAGICLALVALFGLVAAAVAWLAGARKGRGRGSGVL